MKHSAVSLEDKYTLDSGRVYITGIQALVRLPMMQRRRDLAAGLDTAGYISGYRGSPLGGFDNALVQARPLLEEHHVRFHPGLNEDLAATAVWGSQHTEIFPGAKYDGVFAIWYGKGPGVDRSGDVLKHGNFAGAGRRGGVLCIAGDDHGAKPSSMPHQSEQAFVAALMPVLSPSSVQEYLDLGLDEEMAAGSDSPSTSSPSLGRSSPKHPPYRPPNLVPNPAAVDPPPQTITTSPRQQRSSPRAVVLAARANSGKMSPIA